ncbi:hypothetical protein RDABS01_004881 [Bienertia sinuspersici]
MLYIPLLGNPLNN